MLALIWWMYAGYAWLTNSISTRGAAPAGDPARRHGRLPRAGPRRPGRLPRQRPGLRRGLPHRRRGPRVALHLDGLGAVVARLPRASPPTTSSTRCSWSSAARWAAPRRRCCGRSPRSWSGARRGWATARARAASRSRPAHFVERHGLVVIVAIGESVVAGGIGAAGPGGGRRAHPRRRARAAAQRGPVVGLLRRRRRRAGRARAGRAPARRQPWIALEGFGVAHYCLLLGIVLVAGGDQEGHRPRLRPARRRAEALALGGGVALFLAADVVVPPRPGPRARGAPHDRRAAGAWPPSRWAREIAGACAQLARARS